MKGLEGYGSRHTAKRNPFDDARDPQRRFVLRPGVECPRCGTVHFLKEDPNARCVKCDCGETTAFESSQVKRYFASEASFRCGYALQGEWSEEK